MPISILCLFKQPEVFLKVSVLFKPTMINDNGQNENKKKIKVRQRDGLMDEWGFTALLISLIILSQPASEGK